MAGFDEAQARAALTTMLERLAKGPFVTLGIDPSATAEDVRHAFLTLTKRYHPAKFARMSIEMQRQANEVFLQIRGAHDTIARSLPKPPKVRSSAPPPATRQATPPHGLAIEPTSTGRSTPPRGLAVSGRAPAPPQPAAAGRGAGQNRAPSPPLVARGTEPRPRTPSNGAPNEPSRSTPSSGSRANDPASTPPASASSPRPGAPATSSNQRPGAPAASGARPAPKAPTPAFGVRVAPVTPPKPLVQKTQPLPVVAPAFDENAELAAGQELLRRRQWTAARQALQSLANRVPASRHYRALLTYAKAKETPTARLVDEAIAELERLVQAEPSHAIAKAALADLRRK